MSRLATSICVVALVAAVACADNSESQNKVDTSLTRIGIYDSRAIAVAFVGSEVYKATVGKKMADMMAEYKKAKSEGDEKRLEELKAWGEAQQVLFHKQGFSTAPVEDILGHITDRFPEIQKQAKVDMLISKWNKQALAKHKLAEQVDVTMLLVEAFKPNQKQKKSAIEIQKQKPVTLEKMKGHKH